MNQEKQNELIIHLLVSVHAELEATKDFLFGYVAEQGKLTQQQKEYASKIFSEGVTNKKQSLLSQIKLYYEGGLGSVDDLLASL